MEEKIKELLGKLTGVESKENVLEELTRLGFTDTRQTAVVERNRLLSKGKYRVLYDSLRDQIINFYTVERKK